MANAIKEALDNGKLITHPTDERPYQGAVLPKPDGDQSVIVLKEGPTGANELFFDFSTSTTMNRAEFVEAIVAKQYPGYSIRRINQVDYPVSKRDSLDANNLT